MEYRILCFRRDFEEELDQVLSSSRRLEFLVEMCRTLWEQQNRWRRLYQEEVDRLPHDTE